MRYFYLTFLSPLGPGASFHRGDHPLLKTEMSAVTTAIARKVSLNSKGVVVQPSEILFIAIIELEPEVAKSHYPKDWEAKETP